MSRYPPRRISLLVRNLPLDGRGCSPEELREMFERYGEVRDVYLPRDYYSDRPRGFGFVEFLDGRHAEEAMYHLDGISYGGREISVVMSKESRKTPSEMYSKDKYRGSGRRRRSPGRRRSYSRSPSPYRQRYRSRSRSGGHSHRYERRSRSPARGRRYYRRRSRSPPRRDRRESSPYNEDRRDRNGREEDRRGRRESKSPEYNRSNRRSSDSKSPRSEDKRSTYSSSPRSRSRSRSGEAEKGDPMQDIEKNAGDERPEEDKKHSLSPQSGRRDGEDLFHPTASENQDF